jgi:hypothetical protein
MNAFLKEQLIDSLAQVEVERAVHEVQQAVAYIQTLQRMPGNEQYLWDELSNMHEAYRQLGFAIINASKRAAA